MRPVADTSWLLAVLGPSEERHMEARTMSEERGPPAVPLPVLGELLQHLHFTVRQVGSGSTGLAAGRRAADLLRHELGATFLPVQDVEEALRVYRAHPGLSFPDAVGVSEAIVRKVPLWTFDAGQAKVHAKLLRAPRRA